jgi:tRNA modification GTPase
MGEDRVIVSDIAGTTRDVVETSVALSGLPFVFADTAGLRETDDRIEALGVARADAQIRHADILLWLGDPAEAPTRAHVMLIQPKSDLEQATDDRRLPLSSRTGEGLPELLTQLVERARSMLPSEGALALNRRHALAVEEARDALTEGTEADDLAIRADAYRRAMAAFDRLTGSAGVEDVLDALFSRFCLGK